jgi:alkyldihydroxyacetonephosphate synthase
MTDVDELRNLVGPHRVSTDPEDLVRHSRDMSSSALIAKRESATEIGATCVVRPRATEQVAEILRWAHDTETSVVPYGGGSGVCEGIKPRDAVVIDTRAMCEIRDFDEKSRLVRVEGGTLGPDLQKALASWGHMHGHEPQSLAISTVGGWVATRACGQLSVRYGGIEDIVAGLEAVLPGGRVVRSEASPRNSTGPDVARLMIGSEGALGIVTEATLRVHPIPLERAHACVRFEHMSDGVAACRRIVQSDLAPTMMRLYDRDDATLLLMRVEGVEPACLLLLSFDGSRASTRARHATEIAQGDPGDSSLVEHWWQHRNDAVDDFQNVMAGEGILGPHALVDTMEVSGTWSSLRRLYHGVKDALAEHTDFVGCHLSHAYTDGACLYFTMASACEDDVSARARHRIWWTAGMEACLSAGGSISHHHGIGRLKVPWIQRELGGWWDVLRAVKNAVDPKGIMNPGVLGL